jgi:heavy metal translocating P-type ATPase
MLALAVGGTAGGGVLHLVDQPGTAHVVWALTTAIGFVPALWWVVQSARRRKMGVDVIAVLALVGTLATGEYLAGALISLMLATGRSIEERAGARARRELRMLVERAPEFAHRYEAGGLTSPPIEAVRPGDLLLVKPGEVVPVDGVVASGLAVLDESALTGEPVPVERSAGDAVRSGVVNAGPPLDLRATTTASDGTYAAITRLAAAVEAESSPFVRLADRYALVFLLVSVVAAGAAWAWSGAPARAVAVLVVATPCPLILAAPTAIVAGLSRAVRGGVIVKGGDALERLAEGRVLLFDKTGTLTAGRPAVIEISPAAALPADEVLRLAASLDQVSPHVLAVSVVQAAQQRHFPLTLPSAVEDVAGQGIRGRVGEHDVAVGKAGWLSATPNHAWLRGIRRRADLDGAMTVFVEVDNEVAGAIVLLDEIRPDAARTIRRLRRAGVDRVVMVTGDREQVATSVAAVIGADDVLAERTPPDKVAAVRAERQRGPTIMVGDGINDAPALAAADVGVAIATTGATASSQAADVVLTADRLDRLGDAIEIAHRSRRIARESVVAGMGLSVAAMVVAAAGGLPPTWGALLQEVIDVAVILNALRALLAPPGQPRFDPTASRMALRFSDEHRRLQSDVDQLRLVADRLGAVDRLQGLEEVRRVHRLLVEEVAPHEEAEEAELYPVVQRVLGGIDPTGTMTRAHVEIQHSIDLLGRLLDDIGPEGPDETDTLELRRLLYGLHAVLRLHNAQEEEGYLSLADDVVGRREAATTTV